MSLQETAPNPESIITRDGLAQALTELRESQGLTVRDVAKRAGVPVATVGGYFSGRHVPPVSAKAQFTAVLAACGVVEEAAQDGWLGALARVRRQPGRRPSGAPDPYKGLAGFRPEDAEWFFGREALTAVLRDRVLVRPPTPLVVVGASGAGKSSLLQAGLVPALGRAGSPVALLSPGARPVDALAAALDALPPEGIGCAVVVDQAEEIFTVCPDEAERTEFVARLARLAESGTSVVLGLRADFYADALRVPLLARALQETQVVVGPMTAAELRRAIVEPGRKAGVEIDDELVDLLLADLAPGLGAADGGTYEPGALPLLSHALYETWEHGGRRRLTVRDYQAAGGIEGAVAETAERVFGALAPAEQDLARAIFLRLVHVGEDVADTRRRAVREELPDESEEVDALVERFVAARLLTADDESIQISHEALISAWPRLRRWIETDRVGLLTARELADAAAAWARSDLDPGLLARGGRLARFLDRPATAGSRGGPSSLEREFLEVSRRAAEAERVAGVRRTRRLRAMVAALTALLVTVASVSGYAVALRGQASRERDEALSRQFAEAANRVRESDPTVAAQLAVLAFRTAETAEARSALLDSSAVALATRAVGPGGLPAVAVSADGRVAAAVGSEGGLRLWRISGDAEPTLTEIATVPDVSEQSLYAVALAPDGSWVAAGGASGEVRVYALDGDGVVGDPVLLTASASVASLAFAAHGRLLVAGSADGGVGLWRVTGSSFEPGGSLAAGAPATGVAFGPGDEVLAVATSAGTVRRWVLGPAGGPVVVEPDLAVADGPFTSVAFAPDGKALIAGSKAKLAAVWDLESAAGPALGEPALHEDPDSWVNAVAFDSAGGLRAVGGSDRYVYLYEASTDALVGTIPQPGPVTGIAPLPDGRGFLTGGADGVVRLWSSPAPAPLLPGGRAFALAFDSTGERLYAAGTEDALRAFDVSFPGRPRVLGPTLSSPDGGGLTGTLALSPGDDVLITGQFDGAVWVWEVTEEGLRPVAAVPEPAADIIEAVSISPDGRLAVAASDDSTVRLWDIGDPAAPRPAGEPIDAPGSIEFFAAFSPDGRTLAVGGSGPDVVTLWDVSDPTRARPLGDPVEGPELHIYSLDFNPDGTLLAVGSADRTVRLLDVTDPGAPRWLGDPLVGAGDYVYSVAFSPDGTRLAAASGDGVVRVWDVTDPEAPVASAALGAAAQGLYALAFSADGRRLAAGGIDPGLAVWDLDVPGVIDRICRLAGADISDAEWAQYVPSAPRAGPC